MDELPITPDPSVRYVIAAEKLFAALIALMKDPCQSDQIFMEPPTTHLHKEYTYHIVDNNNNVLLPHG